MQGLGLEPHPFRILVVCTGNVYRSPLAERLLRAGLRARFPDSHTEVEVGSAGTAAAAPLAVDDALQQRMLRLGLEPWPSTRQLRADLIGRADLVIAMTRQHLREIVTLLPRSVRHTFTLRELTRLTAAIPVRHHPGSGPATRLRELCAAAWSHRGVVRPARPSDDDIIDPDGKDESVLDQVTADIHIEVNNLLDGLTSSADRPWRHPIEPTVNIQTRLVGGAAGGPS